MVLNRIWNGCRAVVIFVGALLNWIWARLTIVAVVGVIGYVMASSQGLVFAWGTFSNWWFDSRYHLQSTLSKPIFVEQCLPAYYPKEGLEKDIERALDGSQLGVHVLWGPHNSGKSVAASVVASKLQKAGRKGVLLEAPALPDGSDVLEWFRGSLRISSDESLSSLLKEGMSFIIIDNFDAFQRLLVTREFIRSLATESSKYKKFVVLVIVSELIFAADILQWNGRQKIHLVGDVLEHRWSADELRLLMGKKANETALLELAVMAAHPGFIKPFVGNSTRTITSKDKEMAASIKEVWHKAKELLAA